jgi:hypothetical protein
MSETVVGELLEQVATIQVSGAVNFVAAENLVKANVSWTGVNFNRLFLNKREENVPSVMLIASTLKKSSGDGPIIEGLGGNPKIRLAHFFSLIEKQSKGEDGDLHVDGRANIAYIDDDNGVLWAVRAHLSLDSKSWLIEAGAIDDPTKWDAGRLVLSL